MTTAPVFEPTDDVTRRAVVEFGTPLYLYDEDTLRRRAEQVVAFGGPFGFTPRYAMKANPTRAVLQLFAECGLDFDASTVHEARRAVLAGVDLSRIQLTAQMLGEGYEELVRAGMGVTACSLAQLERFGAAFPGGHVGVRINPGEGTGHNNRTNVAGPNASFGIWHEFVPQILEIAARHGLTISHAHHHVGSGGDPVKWAAIAEKTLALLRALPDVTCVNLGGGFKVARVPGETESDLVAAAAAVHASLRAFATETGRELHLELEPGTFLTATAGALIGRVEDVVSTGQDGHTFVKLDVGMAELLRPAMYGAQHQIHFVSAAADGALGAREPLVVVGPCCESGDILTPAPGDPETLAPRDLPRPAVGDLAVVGATGAYCSSMPARGYNSIPAAPEAFVLPDGSLRLVRRRQVLADLLRDEV